MLQIDLLVIIWLGLSASSFCIQAIAADNGHCTITLPTDMPKSEPVLLFAANNVANFSLLKPTGQQTHLPVNSKLLLLCPGSGNAIQALNRESLELICREDGSFATATGQVYSFSQLGCKSIPTSTLLLTSQPCAKNRGFIYEAGFEFNTNEFAAVFSICYDNVTEHTFYTRNILNGAAIDFKIIESTRRAFRANGMKFTTTAANNFYTINNQIARFEAYFGPQQSYVNNTMYMARGHLSPDADYVFSYEQLATYFYVNVAPEFQIINAGNWVRVENLARNLAIAYGGDLEIYTGYMGLLQLPQTAGGALLVPIYLDDGHFIEAPKYYFKVIKHAPTDAAVVMITLNNPFADVSDVDEFCTNVCVRAGVQSEYFSDFKRGYTFCCELQDFKQHYVDLPEDVTAMNLLNGSNEVDEPPVIEEPPVVEEPPMEPNEPIAEGCTISMTMDIPKNEPVYFVATAENPRPQLFKPAGEITTLSLGTTLTLACAGSGNNLELLGQPNLVLTCREDNIFFSYEKMMAYALKDLNCLRIPTSEIRTTARKCGNNKGYIFEAGYELDMDFGSVFEVCYDNLTENTIYTRNVINGATIDYKIIESTRRAFRANGMQLTTTATNNFYTINNQIARFNGYFGPQQTYVNNTMYMARGHLSPDADFIFSYEQLATYFYVNVAPEFQIINAGNWVRVENLARRLSSEFASDLLTFTGVLDILQLPNAAQVLQPIYMDAGQFIAAPKWFYKVLVHPQLATSVVMITLNNPFAVAEDVVEFCTNVCADYGLDSPFFTDISRGYTFCCTLEDFESSVVGLPTFDLPVE